MIEIYGKDNCPYCDMAKALCEQKKLDYVYYQLDKKTKTPFSDAVASKKIDTLYELKVNKAGYGQEGQP